VTDEDLEHAARNAFELGWRRMKLYYMMGLPTETDEDVLGITAAAQRVLDIGREICGTPKKGRRGKGGVSVSISVAVFVPKCYTPFQWAGQLQRDEVRRRQQLMLQSTTDPGIRISYHDANVSVIEGALSKMGRAGFDVVLEAWRRGCRFDAWTDQFSYETWLEAGRAAGYDLEEVAAESFDLESRLPWDHTSPGVGKGFLKREYRRALQGVTTPDCTMTSCTGCGVCPTLGVDNDIAGDRHGR